MVEDIHPRVSDFSQAGCQRFVRVRARARARVIWRVALGRASLGRVSRCPVWRGERWDALRCATSSSRDGGMRDRRDRGMWAVRPGASGGPRRLERGDHGWRRRRDRLRNRWNGSVDWTCSPSRRSTRRDTRRKCDVRPESGSDLFRQ
jgi:hypothetical protein